MVLVAHRNATRIIRPCWQAFLLFSTVFKSTCGLSGTFKALLRVCVCASLFIVCVILACQPTLL